MKKVIILMLLYIGLIFTSCHRELENLNLNDNFEPISEDNIFIDLDYFNWGASIIKDTIGKYHLFYSRWQNDFSEWLTFSEIAHATSDNASGPWKYKETVLKGRGKGYWDAITAHNPKIKYFNGKYYLYYIATNLGNLKYTKQDLLDTSGKSLRQSPIRRTLRENQRTGVAISNSINGPWKRLDKPIIEPSGPITTLTVNPAITKDENGNYYLIVKGDKPNDQRFIRNQAIAISDTPVGPFKIQPKPVIDYLDTEDMSLWYDKKRKCFYGVFHAHEFIGLVTSTDAIHWKQANNMKVLTKKLVTTTGAFLIPDRMERPFVYIENEEPMTLCLAVKKGNTSYTVFIPIKTTKNK